MKLKLYTLWVNTKPFRSKWLLPLLLILVFLLLMITVGNSEEMKCDWSSRDRWECFKPLSEIS